MNFSLVSGSVYQEDSNLIYLGISITNQEAYYDLIVHYTKKRYGPLVCCGLSLYLEGYLTKQSGILPSTADARAAK